jgi:hypothetical protein
MKMKLGRKAVKTDSRTLRLNRYLLDTLPAPPDAVDWTKGITDFGMMLNDQLGDCTVAALGHAVQVWTANSRTEGTVTDEVIESAYEAWDGYQPGNPATDNGGIALDTLNDFKRDTLAGHVLTAFAAATVANTTEIKQAVNLFGGVYAGLQFPESAFDQDTWDVVDDDGGGAGGHCVYIAGYNSTGPLAISWGKLYQMTWAFWLRYFDESFALLSPDWLAANVAPNGFNLNQLTADLAAIR